LPATVYSSGFPAYFAADLNIWGLVTICNPWAWTHGSAWPWIGAIMKFNTSKYKNNHWKRN